MRTRSKMASAWASSDGWLIFDSDLASAIPSSTAIAAPEFVNFVNGMDIEYW